MNVLIVMPLGEFGGGAEQMLHHYLSSRDRSSRLQIYMLFLSSGKLADAAAKLGYPTSIIQAGRVREVHRLIRIQHQIGQLMDAWKVDRVLAWMPKACAYITIPARLRNIPLFIWRHDIPYSLDRLDRWVMRFGRPISIACSSQIANDALQQCGFGGFTSRTIHPGVTPRLVEVSKSAVIRKTILSDENGLIVGTVTRLQPWKRVDLFLKAVACLKKSVPNVKALVVGGESHGLSQGHGEELKKLGRELLGDDAIFVGEQQNVGDWLHAMDVFVLPSDGEPFGIALVEALGAGKPIIACAGGGPEEIVGDGSIGLLLPQYPEPEAMADAMQKMLEPTVLERAHNVNPDYAMRFSPTVMAQSIDHWLRLAR